MGSVHLWKRSVYIIFVRLLLGAPWLRSKAWQAERPAPRGRFIMRMHCQIIRYTWRRRFQEILIHPKIKCLRLPTWKQAQKKKKKIPLSHCLSSHGGNVLFIYPHLNALGWGRLHFVLADAWAAKVPRLLQSELLTHEGVAVPSWTQPLRNWMFWCRHI